MGQRWLKRSVATAAVSVLAALQFGCGEASHLGTGPEVRKSNTVSSFAAVVWIRAGIFGFYFDPDNVRVTAGETVRWDNVTDQPHTVTFVDWNSGIINPGQQVFRDFGEPGIYEYVCLLHGEDGVVTVV